MSNIDKDKKDQAVAWLKRFSKMVRINDYSDAETLFSKDTFGFGTIAAKYSSLAEYNTLQWQECWVGTKDFEFDYQSLMIAAEGDLIIIGALWSSVGIRKNGEEFPREGRATIMLKMDTETNSLVSVHNHYSRTPKNFPQDF